MPPKPTKTLAFPEPYANTLTPDADLQAALDKAIAQGPGKNWRVSVAIVSLEPNGLRKVAHFKGNEVYFSASLLKVAAMYSAFQLRSTLQAIATELGKDAHATDFFKVCAAYLEPKILAKAATIPALKGIKPEHALPHYADAFETVEQAQRAELGVRFTSKLLHHLEKMIAVSDNQSASQCVYASGYGYLNGALAAASFLDPKTNKGVWLAGDFVHKYPYFRIPSANDGLVAQGTTSLQLSRMLTLIHDGKLVNGPSSVEMLELLAKAVAVPECFLNRASDLNFKVTHTKVGLGPLKAENGGHGVYSEGSLLLHDCGRKFVAVWQNLLCGDDYFEPIGKVVRQTLAGFLAKTAPPPARV